MHRILRELAGGIERADRLLLASVLVMLFLGIIVVYGAGSYHRLADSSPLGQHFVIAKHLFMIGVGGVLLLVLMNLDYRWWRRRWLNRSVLVLALVLVALTLLKTRVDASDHRLPSRWLTVGGFSFQPVEMAKLAVIVFLAERLASVRTGERLAPRQLLLMLLLGPGLLAVLLVCQPNYGNVMVLGAVTIVMLFVTGAADRWLRWLTAAVPVVAILGYVVVPKIHERVDKLVEGFRGGSFGEQVDQSLIGLGAGGWKGVGVGQSHNKFAFLPEAHTDFIYSVLGEEWGLLGTLAIVVALVLFTWRGLSIAARAADPFGRALAVGLTSGIAVYGVANIAMVTGVIPVIGVPLPFVSYGGTAMIGALASVGILLNIERGSRSYQVWKRRWDRGGIP